MGRLGRQSITSGDKKICPARRPAPLLFGLRVAAEARAELPGAAAEGEPVVEDFGGLQPDGEPVGDLILLGTLARVNRLVAGDHLRALLAFERRLAHAA